MSSSTESPRVLDLTSLSRASSLGVILIGILVLTGWILDIPSLRTVFPDLVPMRASAAIAFVLSGLSLWMMGRPEIRRRDELISQGCALAVTLFAVITSIEYVFNWDLGIDDMMLKGTIPHGYGGVPLITALNFLLMGLALLAMGKRQGVQLAQVLSLFGGTVGLLSLTGFAYYSAKSVYGLASYIQMPIYTAIAFTLLSLGLLSLHPDLGLMALVTSNGIGGRIIRRLVPMTIAILILLGWLRLTGEGLGLYDTEFGVALMVFLSISILTAVIWWNAHYLEMLDIEKGRAEAKIRESEAKLHTLFDDAPIGIALHRHGIVLDANQVYLRMFGFNNISEIRGINYFDLTAPQHRGEIEEIAKERDRGGDVPNEYESIGLRRDRSQFPILVEATLIQLSDGPATVVFAMDITERKRSHEELVQRTADLIRSNAELQQFAYVASHDLQEPLRMVTSYVQLLQKRYKGRLDSDADEFIGYAVDGASRMQQLINDLLTYSRVGTRGKSFEPTDMGEIVDKTVANLEIAIEETGAIITHDPLPVVMADSSQMLQIMQNLIGNAIKFHGMEPPRVHVSARLEGESWVLSVKDNGIGIDPQFKERIFQIFQRLHNRSEYPGTGIGLAVCKKIVERHDGRIWVDSSPGEGSIFYFTISSRGVDESSNSKSYG